MLTPIFELTQDDQFVKAIIHAPFAKIAETEIVFDAREVLFSSKPYFLRLYLPGEVIENGDESANYDADTKKFTINMPKKERGQFFQGLDMITHLLTPPGKTQAKCLVEELDDDQEDEDDETCWLAEQVPAGSSTAALNPKETRGYGFANRQHGIFSSLREEISEIVDINDPDEISILERRQIAFDVEKAKFSEEHYLADRYSDEEIQALMDQELYNIDGILGCKEDPVSFTMKERDRMKNLPKKHITLSEKESNSASVGLVDIIFAYLYDYRTTSGEHNVESGWTISKLSSTLTCLSSWDDMNGAIIAAVRRSLCYPLYRNWNLSMRILEDAKSVFENGKPMLLKCLLDIHRIFANDSDYRYVLNVLYITDYCIWVQGLSDETVANYSKSINDVKRTLKKADVGLNLDELELAASLAMLEVNDENGTASSMKIAQLDSDDESDE